MDNKVLIECNCTYPEHIMQLSYDEEDDTLEFNIHLPKTFFIDRLVRGIKYILGISDPYSNFAEVLIDRNTLEDKILQAVKLREELV